MKPLSCSEEDGVLSIGGCLCTDLIKQFGSPLYVLDQESIEKNCQDYTNSLKKACPNHLVIYASKANLSVGLAKLLIKQGLGFDVVSEGELHTVLKAGADPEKVFFHGNNKSLSELRFAILNNITLVIDNDFEFQHVLEMAQNLKRTTKIMLRIKPEIDAHTHDFIRTGQLDSKFGLQKNDTLHYVKKATEHSYIQFMGLHAHIGSQIFDIKPFEALVEKMIAEIQLLKDTLNIECSCLNLGGGFGIKYTETDTPKALDQLVEHLANLYISSLKNKGINPPKLILEPGRSIVATAGATFYTVGATKHIPSVKDYLFVDGGMADNPRYILYQADYTVELANKLNETPSKMYTIAGKFCESGDILAQNKHLPEAQVNDIVAFYSTGAYNYSMASNYNRATKPATVLVKDGQSKLLVRRETIDDLLACDML